MYKKLLLLVAVMVSYNATTLSMDGSDSSLKKPSPSQFWPETRGCLSAVLKSGVISFIGSCILAKETSLSNKEALMPHLYFAGMAAVAGGAFDALNRLSKNFADVYTNLSLDLVRLSKNGVSLSPVGIPMTSIPVRVSMTSIAGILAT